MGQDHPRGIQLLGGEHSQIDDFAFVNAGKGCRIGRFVHIASFVSIIGGGEFTIDDFAGLSAGCRVITGTDDYQGPFLTNPTVPREFTNYRISHLIIEKHAIVGTNAVIFPGVTIGEGAAVGACALVRKNLPPWGIYFLRSLDRGAPRPLRRPGSRMTASLRYRGPDAQRGLLSRWSRRRPRAALDSRPRGRVAADARPGHWRHQRVQRRDFQLPGVAGAARLQLRFSQAVRHTYTLQQSQEDFYYSLPYSKLDLILWAKNHGLPAESVAAELGYGSEQVRRVYDDIDQKRRATTYLHAARSCSKASRSCHGSPSSGNLAMVAKRSVPHLPSNRFVLGGGHGGIWSARRPWCFDRRWMHSAMCWRSREVRPPCDGKMNTERDRRSASGQSPL
jgi:hypothetical protein